MKTIDTPWGPAFTMPMFKNRYAVAVLRPGEVPIRKLGDDSVILVKDAERWNAALSDNDIKDRRIKRIAPGTGR